MSKKDFIAIADAIRAASLYGEKPMEDSQLETLARAFRACNSRFNKERWIGYVKGECGPSGGRAK